MKKKGPSVTDPDLSRVGVALRRAAAKAKQLGLQTNTPVYILRNGVIVDLVAEIRAGESAKKTQPKGSGKDKKPLNTKPHKKR